MVRVVYCFADVQVHYVIIFNLERSMVFARILALICGIWHKPVGRRHICPSVHLLYLLKIPWHNIMKFELEI